VRAKVAMLRCGQAVAAELKQAARSEYQAYMDLASSYVEANAPVLLITHGVSGSGKSWYASRLAERLGAIQLRSDVERKRLHGYRADADTGSGVQSGIYTQDASEQTYARLAELAADVLAGGYPAIVDATFLKQAQRSRFRELAATCGVPFVLLHFEADRDTLLRRVRARRAAGTDPSEAGVEVLQTQLASQQPLLPEEQDGLITVDSAAGLAPDELLGLLARYIEPGR
jgi:predicted kinase